MTVIELGGTVTSALTHMALSGLAAILQDQAGVLPRLCWVETDRVRAQLDVPDLNLIQIGTTVGEHAARRTKSDSWVSADLAHEGRTTAVFSPRIKPASTDEQWRRLQTHRHEWLDAIRADERHDLDLRFVQALGEPAYWRFDQKGQQPDEGASRWEMQPRNSGAEFVGNRLRKLATSVAARDAGRTIAGLTGATIEDESERNKSDSRSAAGLTTPRPTDNALAWCALWGIAQFPVIQRVLQRSATAGYLPEGRGGQRHRPAMVVPVPIRPIVLPRFRTLVRGPELIDGGRRGLLAAERAPEASAAALEWFRVRGIGALMRFPVDKVGSVSAPENRLLDGVMIRTGGRPK